MGGVESSEKSSVTQGHADQLVEKPSVTLRLFVDQNRNKVVFAEAGTGFVIVLFSLLTLPMGTIVRLLEKQKLNQMSQGTKLGCFNNLYKSVLEMDIDHFSREACKQMLLYPRSVKEKKCRQLKLSIDDTDVLKYYMCDNAGSKLMCSEGYSNFCSSRCSCGAPMRTEFILTQVLEEDHDHDHIFFGGNTSFIISDDMKVRFNSIGVTMSTLKELSYTDVDNLEEMVVNVTTEEVLALLKCLVTSKTPLTDVFLGKHNPRDMDMPLMQIIFNKLNVAAQGNTVGTSESIEELSVSLFVRKHTTEVLYAESEQDFVDLLLTFLVIPLEYVWELSRSRITLGCIENLYQSFQNLSFTKRAHPSTSKCTLPWFYCCDFEEKLLNVCYAKCFKQLKLRKGSRCFPLSAMDPKSEFIVEHGWVSSGFVKRGATFLISNDLTIKASNPSSTVCLLRKLGVNLDDIEEQVVSISEAEAISLLKASLVTSTPLTTALGSLLLKKPKLERV